MPFVSTAAAEKLFRHQVIAAADQAPGSGFQIFNIGTGVESTVLDIHRHLAQTLDPTAAVTHAPAKPGEQRRSAVDSSLAKQKLGIGCPLALGAGLQKTVEWFRARI